MGWNVGGSDWQFTISLAATGAVTFPSWTNFSSADDYDVDVLSGVGGMHTKTTTGFAGTVTTGPVVYAIRPRKAGGMSHVS